MYQKEKGKSFVDSGNTHKFINYNLGKFLSFLLYPTPQFQVMVTNLGTIIFLWKFHSIKLNMEKYLLDSPKI